MSYNDVYTQAQSITISSFPILANNALSTGEVGVPTAHYNPLWYLFSSPSYGTLNLTVGSNFDIAVYTNNVLQQLNVVAPIAGSGHNITVPILENLQYSISVYSVTSSQTGAFTLAATFVSIPYPANDDFTQAIALTGNIFSASNNNTLATQELYEDPTNYFSTWYSYTPSETGYFTLAQTSGIPLNFKIYNGTDTQNLVKITSAQTSIGLGMLGGITYSIAVSSQNATTYGAFSFSGNITQNFPINYIGPFNNLVFTGNGLNSIVVDPSNNRIYILNPATMVVLYSDNGGTTFSTDRTFPTLANPPQYQTGSSIYLDENGNLLVAIVINQGSNTYNFQSSVRNLNTGIWTDYSSSSIVDLPVSGGGYQTRWAICQSDDGMIHFVITYVRPTVNGSTNNIMYCNFKDTTFSTPTPITQYGSNSLQGVGVNTIQLVNWQSGVYVFWNAIVDGNNAHGNFNYCQINPSSPLVMDAVNSAVAWLTAKTYKVGDLVLENTFIYICLINHTSTVFTTNLASGDWVVLSSYSTPTTVPALVNKQVYNIRSDGTNLYFLIPPNGSLGQGSNPHIYENFVDITPLTHPFWVSGMDVDAFEIDMNGNIVVYGEFINGKGLMVMRINGVWQTGVQGQGISNDKNLDFKGGHTYNFSSLIGF